MDKTKDQVIKLYEDDVLVYELGCIYHELVDILMDIDGVQIFYSYSKPILHFHDLIISVTAYGMPDKLHKRICDLYWQIDIDDWTRSMDKRLPLEKQFIFICGLMGLSIEIFEDEIQERRRLWL